MRRSPLPPRFQQKPPLTMRKLQTIVIYEEFLSIAQGHPRSTIVAPPGFGKSVVLMTITGHLLVKGMRLFNGVQRDFLGSVVLVPSLQIMKGFAEHSALEVPRGIWTQKHQPYTVDLSSFWAQKFHPELGPVSATKAEIGSLFQSGEQGILIMTYAMLRTHWNLVPKDLSKYVLCLDEAHHAPAHQETVIAQHRDAWQTRGGLIIQATATPWYTQSGERIYAEGDPVSGISLRDMKNEKLVPERFEVNRIMLSYAAKTLKELLLDVEPSAELLAAYKVLGEHWVYQGRPITLVRPPDKKHVAALIAVFTAVGARVLDATGDFDKKALTREQKALRYQDLEYDVIIACRRFDEGTDHRMISNVYYLGAPSSVKLVIQVFGRALRQKREIVGYPKEWVDKASFTAFVPKGSEEAYEQYFETHRQDATMIAAYLADMEIGNRVISQFSSNLRESFVFGNKRSGGSARILYRKKVLEALFGDDFSRTQAFDHLQTIIYKVSRELETEANAVDVQEVVREVFRIKDPALRSRVIGVCVDEWKQSPSLTAAAERLEAQFEQTVQDVKEGSIEDEIHRATLALGDAFRRVAEDFLHLHTMSINKGVLHLMTKFTGVEADQIARKLRRLSMSNPTRGEVVRVIASFVTLERKAPTRRSGSCERYGLPGYTFAQLADKWELFGLATDTLEEYGAIRLGAPSRSRRRR